MESKFSHNSPIRPNLIFLNPPPHLDLGAGATGCYHRLESSLRPEGALPYEDTCVPSAVHEKKGVS